MTTISSGFAECGTAAYGGRKVEFGFVAVFTAKKEVRIDENTSVGQKGEWIRILENITDYNL